nr:translation initiation factor IF-2-like isoform X1 [Pan troglodytes]
MSTLSGRPFSSLLLGQGDHRVATWLGRGGDAGPGQSGPGQGQGTGTAWAWTGESGAGPGPACPRCTGAASRGRQGARSGPRRSPRRPRCPAPRRADPASLRSDAPASPRGRSRRVLLLPQVQAEPPEPWPALPAAPKPLASPEAGMAGPGGRRTTSLPRRRGCGCCWRGEAHSPRTARTGRTRCGQAGRRPAPRQVAKAEESFLEIPKAQYCVEDSEKENSFRSLGFPRWSNLQKFIAISIKDTENRSLIWIGSWEMRSFSRASAGTTIRMWTPPTGTVWPGRASRPSTSCRPLSQ